MARVAHPGLADTAMGIFNEYIGQDHCNQLHITRDVDAPIWLANCLKPAMVSALNRDASEHSYRTAVFRGVDQRQRLRTYLRLNGRCGYG